MTEIEPFKSWLNIITQGGALGVLLLLIYKAPAWIQMLKEGRIELTNLIAANHKDARVEFQNALDKNEQRCLEGHKITTEIVKTNTETTAKLSDNIKENTLVTKQLSERLMK